MTTLVTGAAGQVGSEVVRALEAAGLPVAGRDRGALDIRDREALRRTLAHLRPAVVVNCAAFTSVDGAEKDPDTAHAVNAEGAGNVAEASHAVGAALIHLSTDYVFAGHGDAPHAESDPTGPVNVYGRTKLEGEERVRGANPRHLILRTSWVFGATGTNFVRSILAGLRRGRPLEVVNDQRGSPTPAAWLGDTVARLAPRILDRDFRDWGTFHVCGYPSATWYDVALAVRDALPASPGIARPEIRPVSSGTREGAPRPPNSVLASDRARRVFQIDPPKWREALPDVVAALVKTT